MPMALFGPIGRMFLELWRKAVSALLRHGNSCLCAGDPTPGARPITFPSPVMPDLIGHLPLYLSNQLLLRSVLH